MSCEESPCDNPGCKCKEKKAQIEDCCPKKDDPITGRKGCCPEWTESRKHSMGKKEKVDEYYAKVSDLDDEQKKCFEKRRCLLHKYKDTEKDDDACCKGLTGHHLVAGATFNGSGHCYNHKQALTLCSAGMSNDIGRHGLMHAITCVNYIATAKTELSISQMIDESVNSMSTVFPNSACDWKCIRQELSESYENMHESTPAMKKKQKDGQCSAISTNDVCPWHCGYSGNVPSDDFLNKVFDQCMSQISSIL